MSANGIIQAATVIAKTTQTAVGAVLGTSGADVLNIYANYVKGDETGVDVIVSFQRTATGTAHPQVLWSEAGGVYTLEAQKYRFAASGNAVIPVNVEAIDYVKITQGGSNNDGTPTGTLAVSYSME